MVRNVQNLLMEHGLNHFWHKRKIYNFDPYNVFLAIATNILVLFMNGFVVQGHIFHGNDHSFLHSAHYYKNEELDVGLHTWTFVSS